MKIAILSDSHDHKENVAQAVAKVQEMGAGILLFCGDLCAGPVGIALCAFKGPIYFCFGNNDGDRISIQEKMKEAHPQVNFFRDGSGEFEIEGRKIAMNHYPLYAQALARTGDYDMVAFGHDHEARVLTFGKTLAINPGSLNLLKQGANPGFAIYDTANHQATLHNLDGGFLAP